MKGLITFYLLIIFILTSIDSLIITVVIEIKEIDLTPNSLLYART